MSNNLKVNFLTLFKKFPYSSSNEQRLFVNTVQWESLKKEWPCHLYGNDYSKKIHRPVYAMTRVLQWLSEDTVIPFVPEMRGN